MTNKEEPEGLIRPPHLRAENAARKQQQIDGY